MVELEKILEEIRSLPREDFARLRDWILEQDWDEWDTQIEKDVVAGKLDFLVDEALREKEEGKLREF